jgi:hypothetical protein
MRASAGLQATMSPVAGSPIRMPWAQCSKASAHCRSAASSRLRCVMSTQIAPIA